MRKLTTGQGEGCTTGCFLDHEYIKNHYEMIWVDKKNQIWSKCNSANRIFWTIKRYWWCNGRQTVFVWTIFEKQKSR